MADIKKEIVDAIKQYSTIIIHRHVNPDPDALGSQSGLQHVIQHSFPTKIVYTVGEEVNRLQFISRMDLIPDDTYRGALVIVCDTANLSRISDSRYKKGKKLIKIDHHPDYESFGDLSWVDSSYSSASEMLVDLCLDYPDVLKLNKEAARSFYTGIIGDTGNFQKGAISPRTLKTASILRSYNFQPERIHNLLNIKTKHSSHLQRDILMSYARTDKGVAFFVMTEEMLNKYGIDRTEASNLVNTLATLKGIKIWVFFIEYPKEIRVRIRSRNIPIDSVARKYSGGGHPFASGATIRSLEEVNQVIQDLDQICT